MLSGHFSIFGLVFLVLKSLLGIATQWSHVKFAFMTLKLRRRVFFKYIKLGLFPTDTAPYASFSGNQALQSHYMNISQGRDHRLCWPYTKSFQKIQLESKWNMTFQVIPIKKTSVTNRISEKVTFCVPNVPNRNSSSISSNSPLIPVAGFHRLFFGKMDLICANGERDSRTKFASPEFCLPFAQTVKSISVCPFILVNNPLYLSSLHQRKVPWSKENNTFTQLCFFLYRSLPFSKTYDN